MNVEKKYIYWSHEVEYELGESRSAAEYSTENKLLLSSRKFQNAVNAARYIPLQRVPENHKDDTG